MCFTPPFRNSGSRDMLPLCSNSSQRPRVYNRCCLNTAWVKANMQSYHMSTPREALCRNRPCICTPALRLCALGNGCGAFKETSLVKKQDALLSVPAHWWWIFQPDLCSPLLHCVPPCPLLPAAQAPHLLSFRSTLLDSFGSELTFFPPQLPASS